VERINADLANDLGNLVSRATTMLVSFGGGVVPAPGPPGPGEVDLRAGLARALAAVRAAMEEFAFQRALAAIWEWIGAVNRYVDTQAPWALAKDPARAERLRTVLHTLAQALAALATILAPFVPEAAGILAERLGLSGPGRLDEGDSWALLAPGARVTKGAPLFPRVVLASDAVAAGDEKKAVVAGREAAPPSIGMAEFKRLDLRVAEILDAVPVPKSRKLLQLTVSLGAETRTVVAGIAEHYTPAALRGRKVVLVANLEPATLMGVTSNGMVLAGSAGDTLALVSPDRDLPPGATVR
jgi:methionyl-tRNA synthetase